MEATFPAPEATVLLMALNVSNIIPIPFLAFPAGPWMTPFLVATVVLCAFLVGLGFTPRFRRYEHDTSHLGHHTTAEDYTAKAGARLIDSEGGTIIAAI